MYAALPPDFVKYTGAIEHQSARTKYVWECWEHLSEQAREFDPDFVIVDGDCIEGPQRKTNGYELSLSSIADQKQAAIAILQYLKERTPKAKWYFTAGTAYHVGEWHEVEEEIAGELGGTPYDSVGTGKLCREVLWLHCGGGIYIEATHHIPSSSAARMERERTLSLLASKDGWRGVQRADILIRSHIHHFQVLENVDQIVVTTPCMKLADRHSRKASPHLYIPDLGGLFIEVDPEAKKIGRAPCRIIRQLYPIPPVRAAEL